MLLCQRLAITVLAMLVMSLIAEFVWRNVFNADMLSYLAGMVGGLTAIPIWELVKETSPGKQ
jgi:hypothetical protein